LINITQHWACNILQEEVDISDEENEQLIKAGEDYVKTYPHEPDILDPNRKGYNFLYHDAPIVRKFETFLKERIYMMMEVEGFINPRKYDIEVVGSAREFNSGERAKTHNHRGCDYVAVYYADLDVIDDGESNFHKPKGRLLLTDPISQRSRALNHTTCLDITPRPKFFVMHPSYIFHQSEPYGGVRPRKFFVFVIRIAEPIQMPFYKKI
jgi:hypothetical protein